MTIGAIRSILHFMVMGLTMTAFKIVIEYFCMAGRAIHGFVRGAGPWQVISNFSMAFGALDIFMNGIGQDMRIHKE
jgi:hypothetical protein